MKRRFNPKSVDVTGLSRRQARIKLRKAYSYFHRFDDTDNVFRLEQSSEKKKRKKHTSRKYVRENINLI